MLRGFDHVQLACPPGGEDAGEAFYCGVLGLTRVPKPEPLASRGGCWFRGEGFELHLGVDDDFRPARKAHPALLVDDLGALARTLDAAGHTVTWAEPLERGGLRGREASSPRFYVEDPFGNRLEMVAAL